MGGKFQWRKFKDVDLQDSFFDSLKRDYPEFCDWFSSKSRLGEETLVYNDDIGIGAFLYLKEEDEPIELVDEIIPKCKRIKIGTLRLSERQRGIRLGEGAVGVALWKWQEKAVDEIYVTIFEKHLELINLLERFGFLCIGKNDRGECVYLKDRKKIDYSTPYTSFPFITPNFTKAGVIPILESFHDRLFPYSELMGNNKEIEEITAGNGVTKVYVGTPWTTTHYEVGEPVAIYRKFEGDFGKTFKSVVTSFGTITKKIVIKKSGKIIMSLNDYLKNAGNKTVFTREELTNIYMKNLNVEILELIYNGFFGKGHNVNHKSLYTKGLFSAHPYKINYTKDEFIKILEMGDVNVQNIIID